ncbi:molecular chaperone HtpG [Prochlorococcus sp. MIT 1341]|uniref:molecular chaperone HtpG n=1 Tax=Prochlorococcus sp. MIT 1341 TaxID=3096221 RepID=UPI002A753480|nr:molecular chaperone HtpG [Prochlorococcus sp. MIT 1341]
MEEGKIEIHTENIFPIIKKAVYSDHEIFLRELVSNSVDAISKRRMASVSGDCSDADKDQIAISIDRERKTITISDNGIGMTSEEVKRYINQVAFSSAEEFLQKYSKNEDNIIGHFGLGFYSSFMVAKKVELVSLSAIDKSKAVKWSCDGTPNFTLEETDKEEIGTEVVLHIMEDETEYLEPTRIKTLIKKYCDFMPVEILLEGEMINKMTAPWRKSPKEMKDQDYIDLYRYLYPYQGDPLLWVHLKTDYPYTLQGILFFPRTTGRADWESGEINLYCNQVFVSDSIKEVVPRYLLPLRGVIDSPDIPLNVSRSALQTDRRVRSIGGFVAKKVSDKIKSIKDSEPEFYAEAWETIGPFIKIGIMEDEKFAEQISEYVLFGTTSSDKEDVTLISKNGKSYTTLSGYLDRIKEGNEKKVIYCTDEISQRNAISLWKEQGIEVLKAETVIDAQYIPWLETKNNDVKFERVDSGLSGELTEDKSELADKDGETESEKIKTLVKDALSDEKITVQVQALRGEEAPPAMILLPEQMRRINDMGALIEQRLPGLPEHHVLLINQNHSLVKGLMKLHSGGVLVGTGESSPTTSISRDIAIHLYDMAKLSVGGLEPEELAGFQNRSAQLMGQLVDKAQ